MNWYCIRTATRQEQRVVDGLRDLVGAKIDLEWYLPCETRWTRLARVKRAVDHPLLPGYVFVRVDPEHLWRVDQVESVYQILGWSARQNDKDGAQISGFVKELRDAQAAGLFDRTFSSRGKRPKVQKGVKVRISAGQFSGFIGEIVEARGRDRVKLLVSLFGRVGPAIVPLKDIEALDDGPAQAA